MLFSFATIPLIGRNNYCRQGRPKNSDRWAIAKISSTISIEQKHRDTRYYRDTYHLVTCSTKFNPYPGKGRWVKIPQVRFLPKIAVSNGMRQLFLWPCYRPLGFPMQLSVSLYLLPVLRGRFDYNVHVTGFETTSIVRPWRGHVRTVTGNTHVKFEVRIALTILELLALNVKKITGSCDSGRTHLGALVCTNFVVLLRRKLCREKFWSRDRGHTHSRDCSQNIFFRMLRESYVPNLVKIGPKLGSQS